MHSNTPRTVVIADDEMYVRVVIRSILESLQLNVVGEAADGEEALRVFRDKKPDLLLLDVNMPLKTGEDTLRTILGEFPEARVIMFSSVADRDSVERCLDLGARHYIRKDCPPDEMRRIIQEVLEEE
jgi:two-component system chemotaxis response regulator CheY